MAYAGLSSVGCHLRWILRRWCHKHRSHRQFLSCTLDPQPLPSRHWTRKRSITQSGFANVLVTHTGHAHVSVTYAGLPEAAVTTLDPRTLLVGLHWIGWFAYLGFTNAAISSTLDSQTPLSLSQTHRGCCQANWTHRRCSRTHGHAYRTRYRPCCEPCTRKASDTHTGFVHVPFTHIKLANVSVTFAGFPNVSLSVTGIHRHSWSCPFTNSAVSNSGLAYAPVYEHRTRKRSSHERRTRKCPFTHSGRTNGPVPYA